jgi:hypothetical protein
MTKMSEEQAEYKTGQPAKKPSIMDGVKWIYGENVRDRKAVVTIAKVETGAEFIDGNGRKTPGYAVHFVETPKALGVTGTTVRRQLGLACGTEDYTAWAGKKIALYGVPSKKSLTGWAVRVAPVEGQS